VARTKRTERSQLLSGLASIVVVVAPVIWVGLQRPSRLAEPRTIGWFITIVAFTILFSIPLLRPQPAARSLPIQLTLASLALIANWLIPMAIPGVALTGILLALVAAGHAQFSRPLAFSLMAIQTLLLFVIYRWSGGWPVEIALSASLAYGVLQIALQSMWRLAILERSRRIALEGAMAELRSTQAMLEATSRSAQRVEFARDLHDVVGHHLVALGLQLDAAIAEAPTIDGARDDASRSRVARARQLVRLLLADVREVVRSLHEERAVDLRAALQALASEGAGPTVRVTIAPDAPSMTSEVANALLRCAQEAVTNARKHAEASTIAVDLSADRLVVRDDGRGVPDSFGEGFGLRGMRERCASVGCELAVESARGVGTSIIMRWPGERS
jgi:signal transduction histidine kinase